MNTPARIPAPKDLGETTIRMVVEFLPDACQSGGDGTPLLTQEALRLAYAIKGLRGQHAGERTIRRVLQGPEPVEPPPRKIVPFARKGPDVGRAVDPPPPPLGTPPDRLESRARAERYDAFLGSLAALGALSGRRPHPLGPKDPA